MMACSHKDGGYLYSKTDTEVVYACRLCGYKTEPLPLPIPTVYDLSGVFEEK